LLRDFYITSRISVDFSEPDKLLFSGTIKLVKITGVCGALDVRVPEFNVATTIPRLSSGLPVCMNFFAITAVWSSKVSIRSAGWRELQPGGKDLRLTTAVSRDTRRICLLPSVWLSGTC